MHSLACGQTWLSVRGGTVVDDDNEASGISRAEEGGQEDLNAEGEQGGHEDLDAAKSIEPWRLLFLLFFSVLVCVISHLLI